jgi:hypothetical protein
MKKIILAIITLVFMSQVYAQSRIGRDGNIILDGGRTTVRIEIGDERDDRELLQRVRRLEHAVRDLQNKVYDLQTQPRTVTMNVCTGNFFSVGTLVAKAASRTEAMAMVMTDCQSKGGGIFCKEKDIRCEQVEERY